MIKDTIRKLSSPDNLRKFFMGPIYPILVAIIVTVGYFSGLELYFHLLNMALAITAMCFCDSLRPIMIQVWTFVFQISREHTPATNNNTGIPSDYYFTEWRVWVLILSFVAVAVALVYFYVRNKLITAERLRSLPHIIPSFLLAVAFSIGGVLSADWDAGSLGFGLVQCVMWFVIFYLMLIGFTNEKSEELIDYLIYIASIVVIMLTVQLLEIFVTTDVSEMIDPETGGILRAIVSYGWGNTNTAAQSLTVTIPIMFLGVMRAKKRGYYFVMATVAMVASLLNMSRTAMVVGVPIYIVLLIVTFIKSIDKRRYLIEILVIVGCIAIGLLLMRQQVAMIIENYVMRGTGDSGRYKIWENALIAFREDWLFGKGFFGLAKYFPGWSNTEFIPYMAHNTPVHMLGCCGIYGFIAYIVYRVCTTIPFIKRFDMVKGMLGTALLSVFLGSLFENFVFYIMPMLSYSVIYAAAYRYIEEKREESEKAPEGNAPDELAARTDSAADTVPLAQGQE